MMKNRIPCELIRDLFPLYIDKLTNDVTNEQISQHIVECRECHEILERMQEPTVELIAVKNKQEIDFLKKIRNKARNLMLSSILLTIAAISLFLFVRSYVIGNDISGDFLAMDVSVENNTLTITGSTLDKNLSISSAKFMNDNGIIKVSLKAVKASVFHKGTYEKQYTSTNTIAEVWIQDRVVWSHGQRISPMTAAVYEAKHLYIGDMSANGRSAKALNISYYLGNFTNELQTSEQPYGWKMILQNSFSSDRRESMEKTMESYAYVLLATIDNLGEVSFEYVMDGKINIVTVTELEATEFSGENIKEIGQDIKKLEALLIKTGLSNMSYVSDISQNNKDVIQINVTNRSNMEISGMGVSSFVDGVLLGTQGTQHADGTLIKKGQLVSFTLIPEDFGLGELKGTEEIFIEVKISDKNGREYTTKNSIKIMPKLGYNYSFELSGDGESGFVVSQ